eukprot:744421-Prymnesium_polylepis.2
MQVAAEDDDALGAPSDQKATFWSSRQTVDCPLVALDACVLPGVGRRFVPVGKLSAREKGVDKAAERGNDQ